MSAYYALGIGSTGASGLIIGFSALSGTGGQVAIGVFMVINGILFGLAGLADFYMLGMVYWHRTYQIQKPKVEICSLTLVFYNEN